MTARSAAIIIRTHQISLIEAPERIRSARRGDLIHRALSLLEYFSGREDVEQALFQAFALQGEDQGRWKFEEDFIKPLVRALSLPTVMPWFAQGIEHLREIEVVDTSGQLHRIDRVIITREAVAVIDYKVGYREKEHKNQVVLYTELVEAVLGRNVEGYLLYIDEPAVEVVP